MRTAWRHHSRVLFFEWQSNSLSTWWAVPGGTPWAPVCETPQTSRRLCRDALDLPWCMEVSQGTEEPQQIGLTASGCYTSQPRWEDTCTQQCALTHKLKFLHCYFSTFSLADTVVHWHSSLPFQIYTHIYVHTCIDVKVKPDIVSIVFY